MPHTTLMLAYVPMSTSKMRNISRELSVKSIEYVVTSSATGFSVPETNKNTNTGNQVNVSFFIIVNDVANWPHSTDRTLPFFRMPRPPKTSRRGRILPRERGHGAWPVSVLLVNAGATPLGRVGRVGYRGWQRLMGVARRCHPSVASRDWREDWDVSVSTKIG